MSQTETLLLVVLGFSLASLIALFIGRFFWSTALRLGARRMQKQVPSTLVGLQTERDRLRAEYAMLSQRLGSRLEAVKLKMAEQTAEVSRHRNRLETLDATVNARDATIAELKLRIEELTAAQSAQDTANDALQAVLSEKQAELDVALLRAAELAGPAVDGGLSLAGDPQQRLQQRIGQLNQLALSVARDRGGLQQTAVAAGADPLLSEKLGQAERETEDIQKELEKLDAEWSKRLDALQPQEATVQRQTGAVANVISLANRIRALKKDINSR